MQNAVAVAIVDANAGSREGLIRLLQTKPGLSVVGAASGSDEAMRLMTSTRPHVIVTDVRNLEPGGPPLIARLAGATEGAAIIVLTAHATRAERSALLGAGASAVLLKDLDTAALVDTIYAAARSKARVEA
jgi:DNA-binding NarL/FixJ family response regulator